MEPARVRLRVSPGAAYPSIVGPYADGWKVRVAAAPEHGRANEAVIGLVAETLALPRHAVRLVSGDRGRDKIVEVTGIDHAEVEQRFGSVAARRRA